MFKVIIKKACDRIGTEVGEEYTEEKYQYDPYGKVFLKEKEKELSENFVIIDGFKYYYEYKKARHKIDFCLGTKNPKEYCNGYYLYSDKDSGDGIEFVIVSTDNPDFIFR